MNPARAILRFLFLGAVAHQITDALAEGGIFDGTRDRLAATHPRVDEFVRSRPSVRVAVAGALAAVYRPNLLAGNEPPSRLQRAANLAGDALLIDFSARVWDGLLGLIQRSTPVKDVELETVDTPEPLELERSVMPGISIRA